MNKKNILILIATIVVAALVFSFAAANAETCKHERSFENWTTTDTQHKLIVICPDCKTNIVDSSKFDPHVYKNGVCECGKTDPNYQPLNIDLDIEEPEEEPEEEPLILHEHDYKPTDTYKYVIDDDIIHAKYQYMKCECGDGYLDDVAEPEEHTLKHGGCTKCPYKCKHTALDDIEGTTIYEQTDKDFHTVVVSKTCICGLPFEDHYTEEHNYEDDGYLGNGVTHQKQWKCSDCGRYKYGEAEACNLIAIAPAEPEPHEYEGRLYQAFTMKCTICGVETTDTLDVGPAHVHDMKLEVINDSEYRYACTCGEATDVEVFEWDLIFNNGRNVVYKDAATGCQKHYAYTRTSVDGNDHKVIVNEYIDNSSIGIIYMTREDYTEPHNIVTTMNLVNYSEWYERCNDCGYVATHYFNWQIKTVEDNKIYFVDANGGPFTKIEVTTYYPMNNGEQHIKFVSDYYYRNGTFIAKILAENVEEEHTGADTCDYCGATTDHVYVFKTRVLGISYYECTDCVAHYYRYTTDEGEVLFFDNIFDAVESKLGRELRDREWIIVNHLRETRCETF